MLCDGGGAAALVISIVEVDEERGVKLQKGAAGALAVEARRPDGLGASSAPARPLALQKIET